MVHRKRGWLPDSVDKNDYYLDNSEILKLIKQIQLSQRFIRFLGHIEFYLDYYQRKDLDLPQEIKNQLEKPNGTRALLKGLKADLDEIQQDLVTGIDLIAATPYLEATPPFQGRTGSVEPPVDNQVLGLFWEALLRHNLVTSVQSAGLGEDAQEQLSRWLSAVAQKIVQVVLRRQLTRSFQGNLERSIAKALETACLRIELNPQEAVEFTQAKALELGIIQTNDVEIIASRLKQDITTLTSSKGKHIQVSVAGETSVDLEVSALVRGFLYQHLPLASHREPDNDNWLRDKIWQHLQSLTSQANLSGLEWDRSPSLNKTFLKIEPTILHMVRDENNQTLVSLPINPQLMQEINQFVQGDLSEKEGNEVPPTEKEIPAYFLALPQFVDLTYWCPRVKDQGDLNACTANAVATLVEYFENKSFGKVNTASARFLYSVSRRLSPSGETLTQRIKDFLLSGGAPEKYCGVIEIREANSSHLFFQEKSEFQTKEQFLVDEMVGKLITCYKFETASYSLRVMEGDASLGGGDLSFRDFEDEDKLRHLWHRHQYGLGRLKDLYVNLYNKATQQLELRQVRVPVGRYLDRGDGRFWYHLNFSIGSKMYQFKVESWEGGDVWTAEILSPLLDVIESRHKYTSSQVQTRLEQLLPSDRIADFHEEFLNTSTAIRQTFKALKLFGMPPERYWPYISKVPDFDEEPPSFCYSFAQNYQALKYFRLDNSSQVSGNVAVSSSYTATHSSATHSSATHSNSNRADANKPQPTELDLIQIKAVLAAGFPAVFGFPYLEAYESKEAPGEIQSISDTNAVNLSNNRDKIGHVVLAVGYDDSKAIPVRNGHDTEPPCQGAFLIQNSYGEDWGNKGYGWLPYDYVLKGLATDWWSLLQTEWVETGDFGLDTQFGRKPNKTKN